MRHLSSPNGLFLQGLQLCRKGHFALAISIFQKALERFRQIGDRPGEAKALYHLGLNHEALNQLSQALSYYEQSLAITKALCAGPGPTFDHCAKADQAADKISQLYSKTA
jgi:tetratricopeptide (TPR) repeat protein